LTSGLFSSLLFSPGTSLKTLATCAKRIINNFYHSTYSPSAYTSPNPSTTMYLLYLTVLSCILSMKGNDAFIIPLTKRTSSIAITTSTSKSSSVSLFAVKKKSSSKNKKTNNNDADSKISPMLAQWANTSTGSVVKTDSNIEEEAKAPSSKNRPKSKNKQKGVKQLSNRREKQVQRKEEETKRLKAELTLIKKLRLLLGDITADDADESSSSSFSTNDIISIVNQLVENNASSSNNNILRNIAASNKNDNQYRMIWAGSDDAICHVGSGLHNVPLARLQEVFISFFKSTIDVYEVIRIIGPFPNVKNTLKGQINYKGTNPSITYTSMIDGTGKEVLAGKEDNQKIVPLDVILATDNIIVWKKPNDSNDTNNTGEDMLIFIREFDMDGRLDILRVL